MFSYDSPYRNFTIYYNWVKFTKKILFLKIRPISEILHDFENLRKFWPFLLKTLLFSQYLIKIFQIFCGSSLTHRKYFHQISLILEDMEIYAAVHFKDFYLIELQYWDFCYWRVFRFVYTISVNKGCVLGQVHDFSHLL